MTTYKGRILDPTIRIKPSGKLYSYISKVELNSETPSGLASIITKTKGSNAKNTDSRYFLNDEDLNFLKSFKSVEEAPNSVKDKVYDKPLILKDLYWLYDYIRREDPTVYLHELLEGSEIVLPENEVIGRDPKLEKRCQQLRIQQENQRYRSMTKGVDNTRRALPEDTFAYQMKEMNKQIIAVFQFIVSVAAGFAFGFIGIEVFVGTLDFGFRLLLGVMFALIVALAELYFLAKKLNEDYIDTTKKVQ